MTSTPRNRLASWGSRRVVSIESSSTAAPIASKCRSEKRHEKIQLNIWKHRTQRRPRRIGDADIVILKAGIDVGLPNLLDQFVVQRFVGIGLPPQLLILK